MRRVSVSLLAIGLMLVVPTVASADFKPVRDADVAPSSLGPVCNYHAGYAPGDAINISVVSNQWTSSTTVGPNGEKTTVSKGKLVLAFTHVNQTGKLIKSVTRDVGGTTTVTSDPQQPKQGKFVGDGDNWLGFGPNSHRLTGEPGLVFTDLGSHTVVDFLGDIAVKVTITGTSEDGCELLAGPTA